MPNIRLAKPNMTVVDGYFFMFDETLDVLFEITADGTTAFSYPLDTALTNPIRSTEHDGVNFWTLEEGTASGEDIIIKRWLIDNYICKLQETITKNGDVSNKYDSQAFTVEHYHVTVTGTTASGSYTVGITPGYGTKLTSGMKVTLGPNSNGYSETISVAGASDGIVTLSDPTSYAYLADDELQFYTDIWLFNNYDGITVDGGALYNFNAYGGSLITTYPGAVYQDVDSATFYKVDSFSITYGIIDTLAYVKASNLLFVNVEPSGGALSYYGSMAMDNMAAGGGSVVDVDDLAMDSQNIFRLEYVDGGNNYELSTLNSLASSIALEAAPAILPANGIDSSTINATVRDQFFQPIDGRLVTFGEDGDGSLIGSNPVNTDSNGEASIAYKSGTSASVVTVTATVEQS